MALSRTEFPRKVARLSLADLICLVAASAISLGGWLGHSRIVYEMGWGGHPSLTTWRGWSELLCFQFYGIAWFLTIKTASLPPRQRFEPGNVACVAVVLSSGLSFLHSLTMSLGSIINSMSMGRVVIIDGMSVPLAKDSISLGITIGWGVLIWGHQWKKPAGLLELVGCLVGFGFLGFFGIEIGMQWVDAARKAGGLQKLLFTMIETGFMLFV